MCTRPSLVLLLSTLLLALACGPFQTYGQAMQLVCDAPIDCIECNVAAPDQRAQLLAAYISERLWNRDAIDVFSALAMVSPEDKGIILRHAAAEGGVTSCPFADLYGPTAP